ncbi:MAG: phosphatase PAP2 family protein [Bacteroidia bacterium]|nr:phosphatase PAP2 family protein [Bacteroidia bacterium]
MDIFFYYLTYLGDGIFAVTVIMLMLFIRFRNFFFMGLSALVSLGVVQILKNYVFADELRPHAYFDWVKPYKLHFVDGVDINGFNSFPSGHTMSAFCIFFGLALIIKNKWLKFLFLIIAVLTGYSRVYLSEHFLIDIVAGSFIGVFFTLIIYCFFSHIHNNWIDKSFISLIRKSSAK